MVRTIVTTSHKPDLESLSRAERAAVAIGASFVERNQTPFERLRELHCAENVLVAGRQQVTLHTSFGEYFFHPSMSMPRIKAIKQGKPDHMVEAMCLKPGDSVLDCTLGLGSDAIVSSYIVGPSGKVTGLEASPELAYIVKLGLQEYQPSSALIKEAMLRIEVLCTECTQYLKTLPDASVDIVYFDPMFRYPRENSSSMKPLRGVVLQNQLTNQMIIEGLRVAKNRVVMKENNFSKEFARLGFKCVIGGKYSPVAFGVIEKQEAGI